MTVINIQDLIVLLPLLIVGLTAVVVMLSIAFARNHWWNATITVTGLNLALISLIAVVRFIPREVTPMFMVDGYACFYMGFILVTALACATLLHAYMENFTENREEIYLLLTLSTAGGMVLACAQHMASFFIGLELLSVPLYGMIAYTYTNRHALEGGLKYMILSGVASAFLLFGMALLYAHTGSLGFRELAHALSQVSLNQPLFLAGTLMIIIALGFKLSLVPFHLWTPDVYQGAPAPVGAFLSTGSKVAGFAVLVRFLLIGSAQTQPLLVSVLAVISFISMLGGSFLALLQNNIKRLLAYSAIAHMGYILIAIVASTQIENEAVIFYLVTYVSSTLAAFGVIALMSDAGQNGDTEALHNYRGLFWRRPYLTAVMTVAMLSLAGIPLTAGFIGKFYIALTGVDSHLWWLLGALVFSTGMGLYYYFHVIVTMFLVQPGSIRRDAQSGWGQRAGGIMTIALTGLVLLIGVWPDPLMQLIRDSVLAGLR
jgi:NADH-quinone oxidoreductase subunit N